MLNELELSHILIPERVLFLKSKTKNEALQTLAECLATAPQVKDRDELIKRIFYREELMSTGIGMGVAVPHVRLASVTEPVMSTGLCRNPISDYESLDDLPIRLIFMIAAGRFQHAEYLRLLSSLSMKFKSEKLRNQLISAPNTQTFYDILVQREK
jgi:PTS system nitrogen regulatory IIA component